MFLAILQRVIGIYAWRLHAYVLMGNHYHLLLETPEPTLSRGMREMNGIYTQRFNRRHGRVGHLLQGRFKGVLVERQAHLLELTRYVVLNPVRAGIVGSAKRWPWSSYRATAGLIRPPDWLHVDWTLSQFANSRRMARLLYREFVEAAAAASYRPWDRIMGQIYLGGEDFQREMGARFVAADLSDEIPRPQRTVGRPPPESILERVAAAFGTSCRHLRSGRGGRARAVVAYLGRSEGAMGLRQLARLLYVGESRVSRMAREVADELEREPALRQTVAALRRELAKSKVQT